MFTKASEKGQALILITLAAVGLFGFAALAIDGGRVFAERKHVQNAADSSVMAAALAICRNQNPVSVALARANTNGYDNDSSTNWVTVNAPPTTGTYAGVSGYVEVVIESHIPPTFAEVIFDGMLKARARSIGRCGTVTTSTTSIPFNASTFRSVWTGASSGCNSENYFDWSGSSYTIVGGVHSNQDMKIGGSGSNVTGTSTLVDDLLQGSANFSPALNDNTGAVLSNPFATAYTFSRFDTGGDIYNAANATGVKRIVRTTSKIDISFLKSNSCKMNGITCYNDSTKTLQDGIYVTTNTGDTSIEISDSNIHGDGGSSDFANVTFVSQGGIKLSGSSNKFKPYIGNANAAGSTTFLKSLHGFLVATWWNRGGGSSQCKDYTVQTSGSSHQFQGLFYAPNGQLEFSGSSENILGCTIGYTAKLNGSNSTITCDGTWFPQPEINVFVALIE